MTRVELREKLAEAGKKYDGHVTNGSLEEQMKVVIQANRDVAVVIANHIQDLHSELIKKLDAIR
jgi:hypothetical protein